jgi:hypothetical protein
MEEDENLLNENLNGLRFSNDANIIFPRVNFTKNLHTAFLYESFVWSFFMLAVKVKLFICARILVQMRSQYVGEIDS